jgi:NAD(P)-dependent dehydrogenase (short-subunit alcohol dehydrogenase family)
MSTPTGTIIITGGTAGLGYFTALDLARKCPQSHIIIASRSDSKSAATTINKTLGQKNVKFIPLDLSVASKVRSFVETYEEKKYPPIQALVLNAALQFPGDVTYTSDGVEATFGISHLGHALLFHLLKPYFADTTRILVVSSGTHDPAQKTGLPDAKYTTAEELAYPTVESAKNLGRQRYATTKLLNVMWAYALTRRFAKLPKEKKWTAIVYDPGLMPGTGLAREAGPFLQFLWNYVLPYVKPLVRRVVGSPHIYKPQDAGARLASLTVDEKFSGESGVYYMGAEKIKSSVASYDEKNQEELWAWTVKTAAKNDEEARKFEVV